MAVGYELDIEGHDGGYGRLRMSTRFGEVRTLVDRRRKTGNLWWSMTQGIMGEVRWRK